MKKALRIVSRLLLAVAGLAVAAVIALQYEQIISRNLALSHALNSTRAEIAALKAKEQKQERVIERLSDPRGAIPEIHDRLHVVLPREELIYLKQLPSPAPQPTSTERL